MKNCPFNLQRFAEGAASAASASAAPAGNGAQVNANVTANGSTDGQAAKDRRSAYEKMKAEYKEFYDEDVKQNVKARHRDYNQLKAAKTAQDTFLSTLHTKYGTSDIEGLQAAVEADDGFWQDQADKHDMTVEQYKAHVKLQNERDRATGELREMRMQEQAREQYNMWVEQSAEVKAKYPEFDLNESLKNPRFRSMLSAKYSGDYMPSMLDIFELINKDAIAEREKAAVQKNTIDNIKARGLRPDEAGADSSGAVDVRKDVSQLSKQERAELARKAMKGERVTF